MKKKIKKTFKAIDNSFSDALFLPSSSSSPSRPSPSATIQSPSPIPPSSPTFSVNSSVSTSNRFESFDSMGDKPVTMESLMAVLMEVKEMNKKHQEEIIKLSSKVIVLEKENIVLKKEVRSLKESANRHEQATRILTVRILGMPVTTEESSSAPADRNKVAVSTAYENIIKPILVAAKEKKIINAVPQQKTAIIDGFRLKSSSTDKNGRPYPPPIIIRFTEKIFRQAVFLCKREAMPNLFTEGASASVYPRILIVEDLTPATIKKMKELREDDRVEKVWSTEGVIRFTLVSDPSKVRKCPGVFTPINEIIK